MTEFSHIQSAHCETGVIGALFANRGVVLSEPMAFGVGSGLFFCYFPFFKVMNIPITSYRVYPGQIFKNCCRRLKISYHKERFYSENLGITASERLLAQGIPLGLQTNIFWLPYIPKRFRFPFNGHNIIVYGTEGDHFKVSDPLIDQPVLCEKSAIHKARFIKGPLAPRGFLYYPLSFPSELPMKKAIRAAIRDTARNMLSPVPWCGVKGIRTLSTHIRRWSPKLGEEMAKLYLANVVRMQEEIGTGGSGFRYMYSAFLQESADLLGDEKLRQAAAMMSACGDQWRDFAVISVQKCKDRSTVSFDYIADALMDIAKCEEEIFLFLKHQHHAD